MNVCAIVDGLALHAPSAFHCQAAQQIMGIVPKPMNVYVILDMGGHCVLKTMTCVVIRNRACMVQHVPILALTIIDVIAPLDTLVVIVKQKKMNAVLILVKMAEIVLIK
jgi:hypothetical protein